MVVLDEADRMFEMGFEYQMLSIVNNIRPDRQILMFSATMKKKIEGFARELLRKEVRILVGKPGQANADIMQRAEIVQNDEAKWNWLRANIDEFAAEGKVLIFVLSKQGTEELTTQLRNSFRSRQLEINVDCLHGDKDQAVRSKIMQQFKYSRESNKPDALTILVATDIASRGLDVKDIRTVVNFDVAKNIETYVHRIGRTGRMGIEGVTPGKLKHEFSPFLFYNFVPSFVHLFLLLFIICLNLIIFVPPVGTAYTLLTPKDGSFAVDLMQNLNLSMQPVSAQLLQLAQKDAKWGRVKHIAAGGTRKAGRGPPTNSLLSYPRCGYGNNNDNSNS